MRTSRNIVGLATTLGVLRAATLVDVSKCRDYVSNQGLIIIDDDYGNTLRSLVDSGSGLVLSSACQDPHILRLATGAPVAS